MKVTGDEAEDAFSGQTIRPDEDSEEYSDDVIAASRKQFARPKSDVVKEIEALMGGATAAEPKPTRTVQQKPKTKVRRVLKDV